MSTMPSASSRSIGRPRSRWRRPSALVAAVALLIGVAAACEPIPPDTDPPHWTEFSALDFTVTALGPHLTISWSALPDATRYRIDANGVSATVQTGTAASCVLVGLAAATTYDIEVTAYDAAGNWSGSMPNLRARPSRLTAERTTPAGAGGGPTLRCVPTTDADADRLPNVLETGSGTYAHTASTGSSATVADSDEDGIDDGDEVLGTPTGLDLLALGARPQRRDLIVEMDWLTDVTAPARTPCSSVPNLQPTAAQVQAAVAAFASFPVSTPLGGAGINLIVDRGQGGAFTGGNGWPDADGRLSAYESKYYKMAPERLGYVHYSLSVVDFPVNFVGWMTGGSAPRPGSHLTIGYGCGTGPDAFEVGAILSHELGHNANLHHGGHDAENGKPNYQSLMNYDYAYGADLDCDGVPETPRQLRWSDQVRPSIDENAVREADGVCGNKAVDFDGDGQIDQVPYARDLSGDGGLSVLQGSDDADHLSLASSFPRNRSGGPDGPEIHDPLP